MQALLSYLRVLLNIWITSLFQKWNFPVDGMEDAINAVVLAIIALLTWAVLKYITPFIKEKPTTKSDEKDTSTN